MAVRTGIDPDIEEYVEENIGKLSDMIATLTYEIGAGGPIRQAVGYVVRGPRVQGAHIRTEDLRFLPVKMVEEDERKNYPNVSGKKQLFLMEMNRDRVISIVYEAVIS